MYTYVLHCIYDLSIYVFSASFVYLPLGHLGSSFSFTNWPEHFEAIADDTSCVAAKWVTWGIDAPVSSPLAGGDCGCSQYDIAGGELK